MFNENKTVTERDFRMPEFRDADPKDYEFRHGDKKLVRKDRWEMAVRKIASLVGKSSGQGFEIEEVIEAVTDLTSSGKLPEGWPSIWQGGWIEFEDAAFLEDGLLVDILTGDGGYYPNVIYQAKGVITFFNSVGLLASDLSITHVRPSSYRQISI